MILVEDERSGLGGVQKTRCIDLVVVGNGERAYRRSQDGSSVIDLLGYCIVGDDFAASADRAM